MVKTQINENRHNHTLYTLLGKRNGENNGKCERKDFGTCVDKQLHLEREAEDLRGVPGPGLPLPFSGRPAI